MLRQEVLKLYREIFRTIRQVPDKSSQNDLKQWARSDFRNNMQHTEELAIKMLMQYGRRSLTELQTSLNLSSAQLDDSNNISSKASLPTTHCSNSKGSDDKT